MYKLLTIGFIISCLVGFSNTKNKGIALIGGGDCPEAIEWLCQRANNNQFVVLTCSTYFLPEDIIIKYKMEVVPLVVRSREQANSLEIINKIKEAGVLYISGGDQANYVNFWKDTKLSKTINSLVNKIPIGATSAGLAIAGEYYFSALHGTINSEECTIDKNDPRITLGNKFLNIPSLKGYITDSHYTERCRLERHKIFIEKILKDYKLSEIKGLGIDEKTALCLEGTSGLVVGQGRCTILDGISNQFVFQSGQKCNLH